jgi:hypothetical protein
VIAGGKGTAADKYRALEAAGVKTVRSPAELGSAMADLLERRTKAPAAKKVAGKSPRAGAPVRARTAPRKAGLRGKSGRKARPQAAGRRQRTARRPSPKRKR